MTVDNSLVAFFDMALLEELTERALHRWATRKQQKTRGGHVESMDDQGIRINGLQARDRAVLQFGRTPGNGGKPSRFVDHDQIRVCKHHEVVHDFGVRLLVPAGRVAQAAGNLATKGRPQRWIRFRRRSRIRPGRWLPPSHPIRIRRADLRRR